MQSPSNFYVWGCHVHVQVTNVPHQWTRKKHQNRLLVHFLGRATNIHMLDHASYAGKQPPHLLPYLDKRCVKNKMQPTNPNAHTYDNEPWKSEVCKTGSHSMSRKYLKTTNTHTTQHTAKGCSRSA